MRRIQDIVRTNKRSIRSVSINRESKRRSRNRPPNITRPGEDLPNSYQGKGGASFGVWFIAVIAVIFLFFTFTILFSGTKVVITPKSENLSFESNFKAQREAASGRLQFDVMTLNKETSRNVASTGEEFKEEKASGRIVVFNDYSSRNQKLIANTRFETPEGFVYRIKDPIVVPGRSKNSSGETIPGSIEVAVFADETGADYNIGLKDFKVPGFKGVPQYDGFYARSKTEMTGGFAGIVKTVSSADRESATTAMQSELRELLLDEMRAQIPEGFVVYDDGITFTFKSLPEVGEDNKNVSLVENGELSTIIFNKHSLSEHISQLEIDDYDGLPVEAVGIESLIFVLEDKENIDITSVQSILFSLKGDITVLWTYDEETLKADLIGKRKRDVDWVLAEYPSIVEAQIVMRPFWRRSFPDNPKKIKIVQASMD